VARNPVSSRACEEFLISQLRVLSTIDGQEVSHAQRQAVTMQAAKRRIEVLEEQILLQDSNIAEVGVAQQRSEGLLKGIERLIAPKFEAAAVMGPAPGLEKDTDSACQNHPESGVVVKAYLPVMVAVPNLRVSSDAGVSSAWDADYGDTEIESGAIQRGNHVRDNVLPVPIDTAPRDLSHEARPPPPARPDIQATATSLGGPQHFRNNAGLKTASHEAPPTIPAHGMPQSHEQLQTHVHTQANRNASAHGKLPPADGGVGIDGGAAADRESQLTELLSKSRHLLGAACLDQLSQVSSATAQPRFRTPSSVLNPLPPVTLSAHSLSLRPSARLFAVRVCVRVCASTISPTPCSHFPLGAVRRKRLLCTHKRLAKEGRSTSEIWCRAC